MRTTLDIDAPILEELKQLGKERKESLGTLASELLAEGLKGAVKAGDAPTPVIDWRSFHTGGSLVDLEDKEALYAALDDYSA